MKRTVNKEKFEERENSIKIPRMLLADGAGMSVEELNEKLNGRQSFTELEANTISAILYLTPEGRDEIFPPESA